MTKVQLTIAPMGTRYVSARLATPAEETDDKVSHVLVELTHDTPRFSKRPPFETAIAFRIAHPDNPTEALTHCVEAFADELANVLEVRRLGVTEAWPWKFVDAIQALGPEPELEPVADTTIDLEPPEPELELAGNEPALSMIGGSFRPPDLDEESELKGLSATPEPEPPDSTIPPPRVLTERQRFIAARAMGLTPAELELEPEPSTDPGANV